MTKLQPWASYPMGPALRHILGISETDYTGDQAQRPEEATKEAFEGYLSDTLLGNASLSKEEIVDLIEELTNMNFPGLCLELAAANNHHQLDDDFRAMLGLGSASMMEAELDNAVSFLNRAHSLEAQELAPYVNLAEVYFHQQNDDQAYLWALSGLKLDPSHRRLWEIIARIEWEKNKGEAAQKVKEIAQKLNSFSGLSLAAHMLDENDDLLRAQFLEEHYKAGGREEDFLIEWTAALGQSGQFERITQILWEAENLPQFNGKAPWQLYLHAMQANMALEKFDSAKEVLNRLNSKSISLTDAVQKDLNTLKQEIDEHLNKNERG